MIGEMNKGKYIPNYNHISKARITPQSQQSISCFQRATAMAENKKD